MTSTRTGAVPQKRVAKMPRKDLAKTLTAESGTLSIDQLARLSEVSETDIRELMDYGVLAPASSATEPLGFHTDSVAILRHAGHLRRDLALDSAVSVLARSLGGIFGMRFCGTAPVWAEVIVPAFGWLFVRQLPCRPASAD